VNQIEPIDVADDVPYEEKRKRERERILTRRKEPKRKLGQGVEL